MKHTRYLLLLLVLIVCHLCACKDDVIHSGFEDYNQRRDHLVGVWRSEVTSCYSKQVDTGTVYDTVITSGVDTFNDVGRGRIFSPFVKIKWYYQYKPETVLVYYPDFPWAVVYEYTVTESRPDFHELRDTFLESSHEMHDSLYLWPLVHQTRRMTRL